MTRARSLSHLLRQLARLGAVGGAALALVASTESGERGDGSCPVGESCAPGTPDGLLFEGAPLGIWPALTAHTIAAGGRQTFRLTYPDSRDPFDLPFVAKVTAPGHHVVGAGPDRAVVAADSAGTGYLRIVDESGLLYDRLQIDSREVASMRAAPSYAGAYPLLDPPRWAAFAGGRADVSIVLADADGNTIVDEGMAVESPVPAVRNSWDTYALTIASGGNVSLAVDAGHLVDAQVQVPVVEAFDELVPTGPSETGVGGDVTVCFAAWMRNRPELPSDDTLVIGVPRVYRVTGPATPLAVQQYASCLELHTDASGTVTIEAVVGARSWSTSITVRGAGAREAGGLRDWLDAPSEGERAVLARE